MENTQPKIKIIFDEVHLQTMRAIVAEFMKCGEVGNIILATHSATKNIKLTDNDFKCVYKGVLNALNSHRYPTKKGNEYQNVLRLKIFLENEHITQRGCDV